MTGRARIAAYAAVATLAASSALGQVYNGYAWLVPVTGAIAVVAVVSEISRWLRVPAALGPLLVAAAMTCYVTAVYASSSAYARVVPSTESFRVLGRLAGDGFSDVRTLATPVPPHRGLVLLAVVGIAAVALVVDLIAVTMRRAALAGLPLLALFALCTSVAKHGAGWIAFIIGSAGFLALLLADSRDRLSRWGRAVGVSQTHPQGFSWSDQEVMPSPLSVLGRRIGLTAIVVAVVVPLLVPGLRGGIPKGGGNGLGLGHGSSSVVTVNPIVTLRANLNSARATPVLSMRTTTSQPGYLRLTSLDRFDGTTFWPSTLEAPASARVSNGINAPSVDGPPVTTTISIRSLDVHWLPVPAQVMRLQVPGDWRYDAAANTVFSARADTRDLHYTVISVTPAPSAAALRDAGPADPTLRPYLQLPVAQIPAAVKALADRITAKAPTPFDKALAIQDFLTSKPFVYDTSVTGSDSASALADFLLVTHRGFCQQYAAAMAVLARLENIPSRVAVGFTHGVRQPDGSWLITTHDAHAWPELYFTGFGWLPFEPTPRGDGQTQQPAYTAPAGGTSAPTTSQGPNSDVRSSTANQSSGLGAKQREIDGLSAGATTLPGTGRGHKGHGHAVGKTVLLALVLVLLVAPLAGRTVTRRRRWRRAHTPVDLAEAAWAELRACAIDARVPWVDGLTPQATARSLRAEADALMAPELAALDRIVSVVQRTWYAARPDSVDASVLRTDVERIRAGMLSALTPGERFLLRTWPRSTLRSARAAVGRIGEVLDAVDMGAARLRARVSPGPVHSG